MVLPFLQMRALSGSQLPVIYPAKGTSPAPCSSCRHLEIRPPRGEHFKSEAKGSGPLFRLTSPGDVLFWLNLEHHAKTRFAAHHAVVSLWSTVQGVFLDHWQHSADLAELKSVFGIDGRATRPAVN